MSLEITGRRIARLCMIATVALWGWTFVLVKNALADISPLLFNLLRFALAFVLMAIAYRKQWKLLSRRAWLGGAVVGFFLALGFQLQTAGLVLTTPSKSAFLTSATVVLAPLLAEIPGLRYPGIPPLRWNAWAGAMLAAAGIALLTAQKDAAQRGIGGFLPANRGDMLSLGCAFGFALMIVAQDRFSRSGARAPFPPPVPFEQLALLQIGFATIFMAITTPLLESPHMHASRRLAGSLLVTSVLATAAALAVQSWTQHLIPPAHLALILALEPVFAWLASLALLAEGLHARAAAGALLVLAGIGVAESLGLRRAAKQGGGATS